MKPFWLAIILAAAAAVSSGQTATPTRTPTPTPTPQRGVGDAEQISCDYVTTSDTDCSWVIVATLPRSFVTIQPGTNATVATVVIDTQACKLCDWVRFPDTGNVAQQGAQDPLTITAKGRQFEVPGPQYQVRCHTVTVSSGSVLCFVSGEPQK